MGTQAYPGTDVFVAVGSDLQRGVRRREPDDDSPHCKSRRAMSPSASEVSAASTPSEDVSSPVPRSRLYEQRASLPPMTLRLPNFADKDFVPITLQSILVATHEHSIRLLRHLGLLNRCVSIWTQSHPGSSALRASPVSIVDSCDFSTFQ